MKKTNLTELIKNSMVPGKHIHIAMDIVNKLKNQYKLLDKEEYDKLTS